MLHSTAVVSLACTFFFSLRLCIHCTGSLLLSCFDFLFDIQRGVWVSFFFFFVLPRGIWFGVGCLFGSARFGHLHLLVWFLFPPLSLFVVYSFFFALPSFSSTGLVDRR